MLHSGPGPLCARSGRPAGQSTLHCGQNESNDHGHKRLIANVVIKKSVPSKHDFETLRKEGAT